MPDHQTQVALEHNTKSLQELQAQRDALLEAAKMALPYLQERVVDQPGTVTGKVRAAIAACEKA